MFAVSACGGDEKHQESKPQPLPEERQALRPSEYRSEEFEPSLSFRVGEGWSSVPPVVFDVLRIMRGHETGVGLRERPESLRAHQVRYANRGGGPRGLARLVPTTPVPENQRSRTGHHMGSRGQAVRRDLRESAGGLHRWLSDGTRLTHLKGDKLRLIVLEDVDGQPVSIGFASPASEFNELAPEAQELERLVAIAPKYGIEVPPPPPG